MAKGQVRGNREVKKPKQTKKLVAPASSAGAISPKTLAASANKAK